MRKFKIDHLREEETNKKGVAGIYKLWIGGHQFYIGRSIDVQRRAKQHAYELERLFKEFGNRPKDIPETHYKYKIFNHLVANPDVDTLTICLLQKVGPDEDILVAEQGWLDEALIIPGCLNMGFEARPSSADTRKLNNLTREIPL